MLQEQDLIAQNLGHLLPTDPIIDQGAFFLRSVTQVCLYWQHAGAFLCSAEGIIEQWKNPKASEATFNVFRYGTVLCTVALLAGKVVLHAACVRVGQKNIAIVGDSGSGKSTTLALCQQAGISCLTEDEIIIDSPKLLSFSNRGHQLKVWPEVQEQMNVAGAPIFPDVTKKVYPFSFDPPDSPTIDAFLFLEWGENESLEELKPAAAFVKMVAYSKGYILFGSQYKSQLFQQVAQFPSRPAWCYTRPKSNSINHRIVRIIQSL